MVSKEALTLILKDLGADDETIQRLNTVEDMEAYRRYLERKNGIKPEQKINSVPFDDGDKKESISETEEYNMPPKAELNNGSPYSWYELNDPLQPSVDRLNLADPKGRIIKIYNKRFPNGGIF